MTALCEPDPVDQAATAEQQRFVDMAVEWWHGCLSGSHHRQVFRLLGYAGTGKTSSLRLLAARLSVAFVSVRHGEDEVDDDGVKQPVAVAVAPTGRAAMILSAAGMPCQTLHSAIYMPAPVDKTRVAEVEKEIDEAEKAGEDTSALEAELVRLHEYRPILVPKELLAHVVLFVVEEASMVGGTLMKDLQSFGVPIIAVGDPGQLPPVKQSGGCLIEADDKGNLMGDVVLTEVHRQARDSGIIRLATDVRHGAMPCAGDSYGNEVTLLEHSRLGADGYLSADQIICYTREAAWKINTRLRRHLGFEGLLPTGNEIAGRYEKTICTYNRRDLGIVNGQELRFHDVTDDPKCPASFLATVEKKNYRTGRFERLSQWRDDGDGRHKVDVSRQRIWKGGFEEEDVDFKTADGSRMNDRAVRKVLDQRTYGDSLGIEATWAWAITCHKAQGGQFDDVLVHVELGPLRHSRARWMYTAATRARRHLTMVNLLPAESIYA